MQNFKQNDVQRHHDSVAQAAETPSDEVLIQGIVRGTVSALEAFYDRYSRLLYSFAYRIVADHQVTEDIVQESFVAVWKHAASYAPGMGSVRSWLISIVHHRAIDYLRSTRRRATLTSTTPDSIAQEESTGHPDVWDEVWRSLQGAEVRAALMKIPAEQRMVIELAYFQGWTQSEIAKGCQIPLGTVKARIRLGLLHLRRLLEQSS